MRPSVRFTSVDQRTYSVQSDDSNSTSSLTRANNLIPDTMLPKELSSVRLIFVDGRKEGDEIEFGTTTNIALGYQLDEYRRKASRQGEALSFEYGDASVTGTETPEELGMKDEDWIYVFPTVTPVTQSKDDEFEAQAQLARLADDGESAADDDIGEDDEDKEDETVKDARGEPTGAVTANELGTIITSESRIISLIETELDFVTRNLHLVVTKAHDGRTNMFISTQSKDIPIPPVPRKGRRAKSCAIATATASLNADDADNAVSGDTEIQDDTFDTYQELTFPGSESPGFVPGSRPRSSRNTIADPTASKTRPTKIGADRAPYGSKKAARTKKREKALADAATASRTLQGEVGDKAVEMASYSDAVFDPTMSDFNPGNIDPQLGGLAPYSGLAQADAAFQSEYGDFLDEEDRAILDADAHFGDTTNFAIPRMTQADLDTQFPSDVLVPMTQQRDQTFVYQNQDVKGETYTSEYDHELDEANADMDTDTSMLDHEAEEQAILDADTTYINAIKYVDPDYAASLMGGPKLFKRSARASKSKTNRTPQKAPRAAAKPKSASAGNGVSTSKARRNNVGCAKPKNANTGAGVVKGAARKVPKPRGRAAARNKKASITDEVVFDDGDEEEVP